MWTCTIQDKALGIEACEEDALLGKHLEKSIKQYAPREPGATAKIKLLIASQRDTFFQENLLQP